MSGVATCTLQIWVTGIPHEYDEAAIREFWSYCGEVESMHLLSFADSGRFNGTAFVTFKTQVRGWGPNATSRTWVVTTKRRLVGYRHSV